MKKLFTSLCVVCLTLSCGAEEDAGSVIPTDYPAAALVMIDSIGIEFGDFCYVFGSIEGLGYTPDGNIAVLDRMSADIRLFSPEGEFIQRIGGRGGGPGEMRNPLGFFIFPDGRLGALDPWRSGLQIYSNNGEYTGIGLEISNNVHIYPEVISDSSFISMKTEFVIDEGAAPRIAIFIGLFPMSIEPEITYWREEMEINFDTAADLAQKYLLAVSFAVDTVAGIVYIAPYTGTEYRIDRYSMDGQQLGSLSIEIETVNLTEEEMRIDAQYIRQRLSSLEGGDPQYNVRVSDQLTHRLPVTDLEIGPEGNLWARRGTEDIPFFDVWSPEGDLLGKVVMPEGGTGSRSLEFEVFRESILAYDTDPLLYQKIYIIELADMAEELD